MGGLAVYLSVRASYPRPVASRLFPSRAFSATILSLSIAAAQRISSGTGAGARPSLAFTREALAIDVDQGIKGEQMVAAMARILSSRGVPRTIRMDNGPELIPKALDRWAY